MSSFNLWQSGTATLTTLSITVCTASPLVTPTPSFAATASFADVPSVYWARNFIAQLAQRNIIAGFPDGNFKPEQPVTRAQFAAMIGKAFPIAPKRNTIQFTDVSANYWAADAIQKAYTTGFLAGYPGNRFVPDQNIPREQVLVSLANGLNYSVSRSIAETEQYYNDANAISNYARKPLAAATERQIVVNYPNVRFLNPTKVATRADVAAFIYQALVSSGKAAAIGSPYIVAQQPTTTPGGASAMNIKDTNYPIPSGAYFVSPDGKDTNSGRTAVSPWSVAKAIAKAPNGATIVFRGGTYRNVKSIGIPKKLTLQAYPHEQVWLKGSIVVDGWVADGNTWRKDGWNYSFPSTVRSDYLTSNYQMADYRDMVYVNGIALRQVASKAEVVAGTFYVDSADKQLYIGNNPAGKTVEATSQSQAFSMYKGSKNNPAGTVIKGLGFAHYADQGVVVGAPDVKLEDNTFIWNGVAGAFLRGENATDAIVRGNTFSYNGRKGVTGHHAHRVLLENNTISYNNVEHYATDMDAAGAKFTETQDLVWRNNLVEHNYSTGMWVDISSTNSTIVDNIVRYNGDTGIFFEISHGSIIAANVVYGNKYAGIMLSNSSNVEVYNNTLASNGINLRIKDTKRNNPNAAELARGISWVARNNVVRNNIFWKTTGGLLFDASTCSAKNPGMPMIAAADYNAYYYPRSSSDQKSVIKWSLGANKCSVGYNSIAAFKSANNSFEKHALVINNSTTNPFFINAAKGNYRLKSGSPAIGSGSPLPPDVAQAIGLPSRVPVDLGAIQSKRR